MTSPALPPEMCGQQIVDVFKELGYVYICLDLEGYRTGSLNAVLEKKEAGTGR